MPCPSIYPSPRAHSLCLSVSLSHHVPQKPLPVGMCLFAGLSRALLTALSLSVHLGFQLKVKRQKNNCKSFLQHLALTSTPGSYPLPAADLPRGIGVPPFPPSLYLSFPSPVKAGRMIPTSVLRRLVRECPQRARRSLGGEKWQRDTAVANGGGFPSPAWLSWSNRQTDTQTHRQGRAEPARPPHHDSVPRGSLPR